MKTKCWTFTVLAILIAAIGYATEIPKLNIVKTDEQKALIAYKADFENTLEIKVCDNSGDILYFKRTKNPQSEFSKIFDFSELGNGNYRVSVNYGNQSVNRDLTISNKEMKISETERMYEPFWVLKDGNLNVSHLNVPMKNVYLNIYKKGEHVSGVNLGKQMSIQKCIDMSKLPKGDYEISLSDHFNEHWFFVQL